MLCSFQPVTGKTGAGLYWDGLIPTERHCLVNEILSFPPIRSRSWALNAVAVLTNTGRVVVECTRLVWDVRVLAPYSDGDVEMGIQAYEKYHSVETVPV